MRTRRTLSQRTRTAVGAWMPIDGSELALLVVVGLIVLLLTRLVH